jgi:histone arginine demethylase JMJD6
MKKIAEDTHSDPPPREPGGRRIPIQRVRGLTYQQFLKAYIETGTPAIIEDAINLWPALERWTPAFWRSRYGSRRAEVDGKSYRLSELIDLAEQSTAAVPAPYYRNIRIRDEYPELVADISPYPKLCGPNWFLSIVFRPFRRWIVGGGGHYELFIGGAGREFPFLHYDAPGAHTFIHQIGGRKRFVLFEAADSKYLYPCEGKSFSVSRVKNVDDVETDEFPLYRYATRYEGEAGPGETLFMPSGTWHTAKMCSFSVSVAIDVANSTNWSSVIDYMRRRMNFENTLLRWSYMGIMRFAGMLLFMIQLFPDS